MICSKCQLEKPESDFYRGQRRCAACARAYQREHYRRNREKIIAATLARQRQTKPWRDPTIAAMRSAQAMAWKRANRERAREIDRRSYHRRRRRRAWLLAHPELAMRITAALLMNRARPK